MSMSNSVSEVAFARDADRFGGRQRSLHSPVKVVA